VHALILGSIYLYISSYFVAGAGVGGRLFRFSLLCLSIAFLNNAAVFFLSL